MGDESGKDLLSVLGTSLFFFTILNFPDDNQWSVKANMSEKTAGKMTHEEFSEQIPSVVIAGQETTVRRLSSTIFIISFYFQANTIAWGLYELAKNPEYQEKLRQEITSKLTAGDPHYNDLDGLVHLNAFMKVCTSGHTAEFILSSKCRNYYEYTLDCLSPSVRLPKTQ